LSAEELGYAHELGVLKLYALRKESHLCPVDSEKAPIIDTALTSSPVGGPPKVISWEDTSLIHNSCHSMSWADVPRRPWAVDRTSAWAPAGLLRLYGFANSIVANAGFALAIAAVDCAAINDEEQLSQLVPSTASSPNINTLINKLLFGVVNNPRSRWCANFIMGAYLTTHCPEYGRAISGISQSLFGQFVLNCDVARGNHVSPPIVNQMPWASYPYLVVPDNTPYALLDVPIMPNEQWEEWVGIQHVEENWDQTIPARVFGSFTAIP